MTLPSGCCFDRTINTLVSKTKGSSSQPRRSSARSGAEQLVALLLALQPLHPLLVHLLRHLLIPLLLLFRCALLFERSYAPLQSTKCQPCPPIEHRLVRTAYLALLFLLILHLLLLRLHQLLRGPKFCALLIGCEAGGWAKGLFRGVPLLACKLKSRSAGESQLLRIERMCKLTIPSHAQRLLGRLCDSLYCGRHV
jgi:hypothetical protein